MEAQFGAQANYLVDFPHLCEYLSAAAEVIAAKDKSAWMPEKKKLAERQSLAGGSGKSTTLRRRSRHSRPRGPGPCLLSLYLQPHSIFGLQRRPGSRPAHRFGRDRECSRLCVPEAAQDLRCLVEDGKSKKGNRSTGVTGERGLGRILDQRASGGCVN